MLIEWSDALPGVAANKLTDAVPHAVTQPTGWRSRAEASFVSLEVTEVRHA